ncbi:MAG: hypothetical protein WAM69_03485 [Candidatus Sulfotelmatobacter sp.]
MAAVPALPAQAPASSSSPRGKKSAPASPLNSGAVSNGVYRNPAFEFTCSIPAGWVFRTEEMNAPAGDTRAVADKTAEDASNAGRVLLAAFSRPPEARAQDVNSSILIAAESAASYPGLTDAAQYFGPVSEVARAQGFEEVEEPYEFVVGRKTVARADFQKDVGTRVMRQSTLVMLAHGYAVSFTFIGGTEDEVEELVQGLSFGAGAKPAK